MLTQPTFEQIVHDHQALVFRTLARLLGRNVHLEDLAQDVFLRLFRALPTFRGDALLSTFLYRITVNVAHTELKRRTRDDRRNVSLSAPVSAAPESPTWEDRLSASDTSALDLLQQAEFALLVDQHLALLSNLERAALVLYHQEERSYQEIATILDLPVNTVRTHLYRGRSKLRTALLHTAGAVHA